MPGEREADRRGRKRSGRKTEDRAVVQQVAETASHLVAHELRPLTFGRGDGCGAGQRLRHPHAEARIGALDPVPEGGERLRDLKRALSAGPDRETLGSEGRLGGGASQAGEVRPDPAQPVGDAWLGEGEGVARDEQPVRNCLVFRQGGFAEHRLRHPEESARVAREPARGVEARGLGNHAREVDPPVGRPQAVETAEARGDSHGAAGVGAEREVDRPRRHRGRGPGRRPAGNEPGRGRIAGGAVEGVLAEDAEGDLVGNRLAGHRRSGPEQALDERGVPFRNRIGAAEVRVPAPGRLTCDVEEVLDRKGEVGERTACDPRDSDVGPRHEGAPRLKPRPGLGTGLRAGPCPVLPDARSRRIAAHLSTAPPIHSTRRRSPGARRTVPPSRAAPAPPVPIRPPARPTR